MTRLSLENLRVTRGKRVVTDDVSLDLGPGEFVGLIGANGAGKTTLMRAALGLIPAQGKSSLAALSPDARAREAAWMPQGRDLAWALPVEALVRLGRLPHDGRRRDDLADAAIEAALAQMELTAMRHRPATELSGGELARALIARVLAQQTPLILADEPIAGLDPAHQIATMRLFRELADDGRGLLVSLHDLGLAARYCTRLVMLSGGQVVGDGHPCEVLSEENMARYFGIRSHYADTPEGPFFHPLDTI